MIDRPPPPNSPEISFLDMWRRLLRAIDQRIKEALAEARIDAGQLVGELPPPMAGAQTIDELSDVDTSTIAPAIGETLVWDGSNWVPGEGGGGTPYEPLANGDLLTPELIFADGDVIMVEME